MITQFLYLMFCFLPYSHVKALNRAFHPLGNSGQKTPELVAHDVIETSGSILRLAESLSKRLLGTYTQVRDDDAAAPSTNPTSVAVKLSPAQLAAHEVYRFFVTK